MSSGIKILQSDGQTLDDTVAGFTFVDLVYLSPDASGYLYFPQCAGMQIVTSSCAASATAFGLHSVSVSYGAYPVLYYFPTGGPAPHTATQLMVFAR